MRNNVLRVSAIMQTEVPHVSETASVSRAQRRMREHGVSLLAVCDDDGRIVGCVKMRDVALGLASETSSVERCVVEVMCRDVITCRGDDDPSAVARDLVARRQTRAFCVDRRGVLVGVVDLSDAQRAQRRRSARSLVFAKAR